MSEKNESRDWELTCDHCNGDGFVYVEGQVAERKSDVQEFKEECECCEGRGFTIAFEDIPGIAEYVRKTRPAPSAPGDALNAARYRWLREKAHQTAGRAPAAVLCDESDMFQRGEAGSESGFIHGKELDAAIDAALAAQVPQQGEA